MAFSKRSRQVKTRESRDLFEFLCWIALIDLPGIDFRSVHPVTGGLTPGRPGGFIDRRALNTTHYESFPTEIA